MSSLRHRITQASDVAGVMKLLSDPGDDSYGPSTTEGLTPLVARLLRERALRGPLLESRRPDPEAPNPVLHGVAMTGFVELEQAREWIAAPPPHLVDHVLAREQAREPVLLRPDRVAERNAEGALALVFIAFRIAPAPDQAALNTYIAQMFESFRLFHAGYRCPLALHPAPPTARARQSLAGLHFKPVGDGASFWLLTTEELKQAPFSPFIVLGGAPPPRFGFSASEQETLQFALLGYTDAEIARQFEISLDTVRKRWRSIFGRVADQAGISIMPRTDGDPSKRGPEKRGALLNYLNGHLEELRPYRAARARADQGVSTSVKS
ncbi:MAG TPA: hypothetical protein VGK73_25650 [Polyangiaceae bacterium]